MINLDTIILLVAAYLLGSMPFSVWVGQLFYKIDVRENMGAEMQEQQIQCESWVKKPDLLFYF